MFSWTFSVRIFLYYQIFWTGAYSSLCSFLFICFFPFIKINSFHSVSNFHLLYMHVNLYFVRSNGMSIIKFMVLNLWTKPRTKVNLFRLFGFLKWRTCVRNWMTDSSILPPPKWKMTVLCFKCGSRGTENIDKEDSWLVPLMGGVLARANLLVFSLTLFLWFLWWMIIVIFGLCSVIAANFSQLLLKLRGSCKFD